MAEVTKDLDGDSEQSRSFYEVPCTGVTLTINPQDWSLALSVPHVCSLGGTSRPLTFNFHFPPLSLFNFFFYL